MDRPLASLDQAWPNRPLPSCETAVAAEVSMIREAPRAEARPMAKMPVVEPAMPEVRAMEEGPVHEVRAVDEEWPIHEVTPANDNGGFFDHHDRANDVPANEVLADHDLTMVGDVAAAAVVRPRTQFQRLGGLTERYSTRRNGQRRRRAGDDRRRRERRNET
jgi:hypothetical protein